MNVNVDELFEKYANTHTIYGVIMNKKAFTEAIAEIISSESLPADLLVRQGDSQPVFACGDYEALEYLLANYIMGWAMLEYKIDLEKPQTLRLAKELRTKLEKLASKSA